METTPFWSRVGQWVRRAGQPNDYEGVQPADSGPGELSMLREKRAPGSPEHADALAPTSTPAKVSAVRPAPKWERLAEEYSRVVKLMDAMQEHMATQSQHSKRTTELLERLCESVTDLPDSSRQQLEMLTAVRESATADSASLRRLTEELSQLPPLADAQRETMVSIGRHLESTNDVGAKTNEAMAAVQQALTGVNESTVASTTTMRELWGHASGQNAQLSELLKKQAQQFTVFAWSALGLALIALAIGALALFR